MKINKKGFTLIELLVVIAIIGLLSTMAIVALNGARRKARDARRVSDIKQIQTALELFQNDNSDYPDGTSDGQKMEAGTALSDGTTTFMASIPDDPTSDYAYTYYYGDSSSYALDFRLEAPTGGLGDSSWSEIYCQATQAGISCQSSPFTH